MANLKLSKAKIIKARMRSDLKEQGESIPFEFNNLGIKLTGYMQPNDRVFNVRQPDNLDNEEFNLEVRIGNLWFCFISIDFEYSPFEKD